MNGLAMLLINLNITTRAYLRFSLKRTSEECCITVISCHHARPFLMLPSHNTNPFYYHHLISNPDTIYKIVCLVFMIPLNFSPRKIKSGSIKTRFLNHHHVWSCLHTNNVRHSMVNRPPAFFLFFTKVYLLQAFGQDVQMLSFAR